MLIRDELHHGDNYQVRTVDVAEGLDAFLDFLNSGPYGAGKVATKDNKFAVASFEQFSATGKSEFGWRRFLRIDSAAAWAEAVSEDMWDGYDWDTYSLAYAAGSIAGVKLDLEADDDQGRLLTGTNGWVIRYDAQAAQWRAEL